MGAPVDRVEAPGPPGNAPANSVSDIPPTLPRAGHSPTQGPATPPSRDTVPARPAIASIGRPPSPHRAELERSPPPAPPMASTLRPAAAVSGPVRVVRAPKGSARCAPAPGGPASRAHATILSLWRPTLWFL